MDYFRIYKKKIPKYKIKKQKDLALFKVSKINNNNKKKFLTFRIHNKKNNHKLGLNNRYLVKNIKIIKIQFQGFFKIKIKN